MITSVVNNYNFEQRSKEITNPASGLSKEVVGTGDGSWNSVAITIPTTSLWPNATDLHHIYYNVLLKRNILYIVLKLKLRQKIVNLRYEIENTTK